MSNAKFNQMIERLETKILPKEEIEVKSNDVTTTILKNNNTSIAKNTQDSVVEENGQQRSKKNKVMIGVAIGVGVISIIALVILKRKK